MSEPKQSDATTEVDVGGRTLRLSNLDKVLYPATGTTKAEVMHYYLTVQARLLAVAGLRPITRVRFPEGVGAAPFFEKNLPAGAPEWVPRFCTTHRDGRRLCYPLLEPDSAPALLTWLAQLAVLELHVPQWQVVEGVPAPPDRLVVDLDPGEPAGLAECCAVAELVRVALEHDGLRPWPVTSGSKGMQVYAAIPAGHRAGADSAAYARGLAQTLAKALPDLIEWRMAKELRTGKVFVDWSQNNPAKTTVAPWSLRGRERPTVAVPVSWEEVAAPLREQFTLDAALERISRTPTDPNRP